MSWEPTTVGFTPNSAGIHLIYATREGKPYMDVTFYRGVPAVIDSYTYADPFSDATAQITFSQITELDDLEDVWWCKELSQIDIYWAPASPTKTSPWDIPATNPATGQPGWYINVGAKTVVWEGHTYSYSPDSSGSIIQCQGAMFALDRYVSKPTYPPRPQPVEDLIRKAFNAHPTHLKSFREEDVRWPVGWNKLYSNTSIEPGKTYNNYTVDGLNIGDKWTGYATRNTGNWGKLLTGFVAELLGVMYTPDDCGTVEGNQWTILKDSGRQPYLTVRDRFKTPDFSLFAGTPGVKVALSRDALSTSTIYYGTGVATDGSKWSNTAISPNGDTTEYLPLAHFGGHWPYQPGVIAGETLIQFGSGIGLDQAITASEKMLKRDYDPGWVGDITLKVDPNSSLSKWSIRPGMCVQVKNYAGLGTLNLHIAQVQCSPADQSVRLTVDSKFRDLLTIEEVAKNIRDPLTPAKLLRVGVRSNAIDDVLQPWDYTAGSGMIPYEARSFFLEMPRDIRYPWLDWTRSHPPRDFGEYYVNVNASSELSKERWNVASFLTSSTFRARLAQFVCVDEDGEIVEIPFHVSIHDVNKIEDSSDFVESGVDGSLQSPWWWAALPQDPTKGNELYSPFASVNMWERIATDGTSLEGTTFYPPQSLVVGWGNYSQPAGYSPGRKTDGTPPTGRLVDESEWGFDTVGGTHNERLSPSGFQNNPSQTKLTCAFYAEHTESVYFIGRIFRMEPGS